MKTEKDGESCYPSNDYWNPKLPDWSEWQRIHQTKLWIAVVLASNLDPSNFQLQKDGVLARQMYPLPQGIEDLLTAAKGSIGVGDVLRLKKMSPAGFEESDVDMANFTRWLQSIRYPVPEGFPWAPEEVDTKNLVWPWGRHSTVLLRSLAEVADKLWKNYDPADSSSAPTNKQVSDWLKKRGVAERNAKAIATILRADKLPPGPRK